MSRDQFEYDVGGELRDKYGRVEYVLTAKHTAPISTDTQRAYTPTDADGRQQIVIQDPSGHDLSIASVSAGSAAKNTSPVADGAGSYAFRRRIPQFQALDYGIDTAGNDTNTGPWANLLADVAAQTNPRGAHVVLPEGDICLNNQTLGSTQLFKNGRLILEGQGDATRVFPGGGQGQALTLSGFNSGHSTLLTIEVRGIKLGYGSDIASVDLPYTQPILTIRQGIKFVIEGVSAWTTGTGKLIMLDSIYNGTVRDCFLATNSYAIPLEWNLVTASQKADSISFRDIMCEGQYGFVMMGDGTGTFTETISLDEYKYVTGGGTINYAESFLASSAIAGATTITLNAGDGASFAVNDSIAIGDGEKGFDVNKIAAISTDTLTLAQPLAWPHSTTSHRQQVIRGGIGFVTPGTGAHVIHVHDSHFEHGSVGVLAWGGQQINIDNSMNTCRALVRPIATQDVLIGPVTTTGGSITGGGTANILYDVPSWATGGAAPSRIMVDGPITVPTGLGIALTANLQGTSFNMDEFGYIAPTLATGFAQGAYNPFGVKLGRDGLKFRGRLDMAAAVSAASPVFTLPTLMVPTRSSLVGAWQTNTQSLTATPVLNTLRVRGTDQANPGEVDMQIASSAAGFLSLDSVPPISVH